MSLPGQFLSRRCFTLCITMEAEPRSSTNATTVAVAKITGEMGWSVEEKKVCLRLFGADQKIASSWKNVF